jgi:hypothetical protein
MSRVSHLIMSLAPALTWPAVAHSEWDLVPEIWIGAETNDNPTLLIADPTTPELDDVDDDPASRILAEVRLRADGVFPRGDFFIEPSVFTDAYAEGSSEFQSTDARLRSGGEHRGERAAVGFSADLASESILGTEFLDAQPIDIDAEEPPAVDTVLLGRNERRTLAVLSPYTAVELSERGALRFDGQLMDVGYEADTITARTDFSAATLGAAYLRRLSAGNTLTTRLYGSRYDVEADQADTITRGIEMVFSHEVTDVWSTSIAWGVARSEFTNVDALGNAVDGEADNPTFALNVRRRSERSSVNFDLGRGVEPDSFGFPAVRDELRVAWLRQMSQKVRGGMAIRVIESADIGDVLGADQRYGWVDLDLDWAFGELWSLVLGYEYAYRAIDTLEEDARSNSVSVGFNYRGRSQRSAIRTATEAAAETVRPTAPQQ